MCDICSTNATDEKYVSYLVKKLEGNRLLGEHRYDCEDNIEMNIEDAGCECVDWNQY
jgi:hypothetical protein